MNFYIHMIQIFDNFIEVVKIKNKSPVLSFSTHTNASSNIAYLTIYLTYTFSPTYYTSNRDIYLLIGNIIREKKSNCRNYIIMNTSKSSSKICYGLVSSRESIFYIILSKIKFLKIPVINFILF